MSLIATFGESISPQASWSGCHSGGDGGVVGVARRQGAREMIPVVSAVAVGDHHCTQKAVYRHLHLAGAGHFNIEISRDILAGNFPVGLFVY